MAATPLRLLSCRCLFTNVCRSSVVNRTLKLVNNKRTTQETLPLIPETSKWRCLSSLADVKAKLDPAEEKLQVGQEDELYSTIDLEIKSHDKEVLRSYCMFISMALTNLEISYGRRNPAKDILRYTLLKSVHVHKKALAQYEMRTNYHIITLKKVTGSTADTVLEYIERNLPEGVAMKVTKHRLAGLPNHLQNPIAIIEKNKKEKRFQKELAKRERRERRKQEALKGQLNDAVVQTETDQPSVETVVFPVDTSDQQDHFKSSYESVPKSSEEKAKKSDIIETKESNSIEMESTSDKKQESDPDKTSKLSSDMSDSSSSSSDESSDDSSYEAEKLDK